ncbi:MAG: DNA-primase RepB domain-containing protein [Aggregatilineales bacterium]
MESNRLGWGAFVAMGLRRQGLKRYQRGRESDILALPAVFVDVDRSDEETLRRLQAIQPRPSCITFSGGGYHAYWWLNEPLSDMTLARTILRGLQRKAGGDALSVVNSLRLPGSRNSKPQRHNALCHIVEQQNSYYPATAFEQLLPRPMKKLVPQRTKKPNRQHRAGNTLNPALLQAVSDHLLHMGYVGRGDWLSGHCLYPHQHQHDDRHPSFGFNTSTGYGNCFRCGSILLKDICLTLGIQPDDYGGLFL